jgi:ParB-like chromosome segregation protein Spo0J
MKIKVSSLKHHPKNKEIYTLSSIEELMESISEVGLLQPLIIDSGRVCDKLRRSFVGYDLRLIY